MFPLGIVFWFIFSSFVLYFCWFSCGWFQFFGHIPSEVIVIRDECPTCKKGKHSANFHHSDDAPKKDETQKSPKEKNIEDSLTESTDEGKAAGDNKV